MGVEVWPTGTSLRKTRYPTMLPLTAVLGDHVSVADWLVTCSALRPVGAGGGVCVVSTFRLGDGALR